MSGDVHVRLCEKLGGGVSLGLLTPISRFVSDPVIFAFSTNIIIFSKEYSKINKLQNKDSMVI